MRPFHLTEQEIRRAQLERSLTPCQMAMLERLLERLAGKQEAAKAPPTQAPNVIRLR